MDWLTKQWPAKLTALCVGAGISLLTLAGLALSVWLLYEYSLWLARGIGWFFGTIAGSAVAAYQQFAH